MRSRLSWFALVLVACGGGTAADAGLDAQPLVYEDAGATPDAGVDAAPSDGGSDASTPDAGAGDAGLDDAGVGDDAGAACDPSAVRFEGIARGPLEVGARCDEVNVCVANGSEAARVMAASSRFSCGPSSEFPCTGMTCSYRDPGGPGVIDAAELEAICAVTVLTPTPDVACVVFGP